MDWRKSTYSDTNGGQCVETATASDVILVRDTTDRDGVTLSVPAETWRAFTDSLR
jgi:Domain of unknown function (DUF397)